MAYAENYDAVFRGGAVPPQVDAKATAQAEEWVRNRAQARAAAGAVPASAPAAPVTGGTGTMYRAGKFVGRMVGGRAVPTLALGTMGFGMADQMAAVQADPETRSPVERTLQVLSGADTFGIGAHVASAFGFGAPATAPAAPVVKPAAPAVPVTGFGAAPALTPQTGFQAQVRAVDNRIAGDVTPANAPVTALDSAGIDAALAGGPQPMSGTGAIRNNRTGAVTTIDSRDSGGSGTVIDNNTGKVVADGSVGSYIGAVMNQRQAAQTEARKALVARYDLEYAGKGATAAKDVAAAHNEVFRTNAAAAHLKANPADFAGAAAIASGRALPKDDFGAIPSTTGNDLITYDKSGKQPAQIQTPTRYATEANIGASMAARGMTRAAAIAAYKAQGLDVSRIKP